MKIGIDARMYSSAFTGIGRYVYELVQGLAQLPQKHEYVLFMNEPEFSKFTPPDERFRAVRANAKHYSWKEQWRFARLLWKENLDLMHFTHFNAPLLYRRPSVVTIHDLTISFYPGKKFRSPLYRLGYHVILHSIVKRAKRIFAVSENTKKDLIQITHVPAERILTTYLGVSSAFSPLDDPQKAAILKERYDISKPYFLYTGVWRDHKNLVRLLEAFKKLRQEGLEAQLIITGKEDPVYPEVLQAVERLQLQNEVLFPGLVPEEDLIALYQFARVYAFPSLYEGFGLPPLEAMRCRVPVAASRVSSIPEICGEGNALYFDPLNVLDMSQKLYEAFTNEPLRAELSERGFQHSQKFTWENLAKTTVKVYEEVA